MIEVFLIFLTFLIISLMLGILFRLDFSKIKEGDNANNNIIIRFFEKQKDYFGLNQFARELAQGLEEVKNTKS